MQKPITIEVSTISILNKTDNYYVLSDGPSGFVVSGMSKLDNKLLFAIPFDTLDEAIKKFTLLTEK